jgi:hypothetical protein
MHPIVSDIERLAVTVSVLDPVPVTGPRTADRLFGSSGIGSNVGGRAGLLQPEQTIATAHTAAAGHRKRSFHFTCRAYQTLVPAVNDALFAGHQRARPGGPGRSAAEHVTLKEGEAGPAHRTVRPLETVNHHLNTFRQRSPGSRHNRYDAVRLRLMCDTVASLDARHSRNASQADRGQVGSESWPVASPCG